MTDQAPSLQDPARRRLFGAMPAAAIVAMIGVTSSKAGQLPPVGTGWREALLIVANSKPWIETLTGLGGWEIVWAGGLDGALNSLWRLPASARARQTLLRNVGASTGLIRLVEVEGVARKRIRADDQTWESGGLGALDLRVIDLEATRAALEARGWRAPAEPVRYGVYGVEVIQWAPISPDGIRLSFIQRISPPLVGWSELKHWSRLTNAAMTVKDMAASDAFYRDALGLIQVSKATTLGSGGPNVLGLPWPVAERLAVDIRGFAGPIPGGGAIELISMPAVQGRDFSADAHPPNLGIAGLRFLVPDVRSLRAHLQAMETPVWTPREPVACAPYGPCLAVTALDPNGVWLEFLQRLRAT